jgi:hypothetical protein
MLTTPEIARRRRKLCARCPDPCGEVPDVTLARSACPLSPPMWVAAPRARAPVKPVQPFGLGDAVAVVAEPIARAADRVLGTDWQNCPGCSQRRAKLNAWPRAIRAHLLGR